VQYGYELSSGGVVRSIRWAEHRRETSAIQYNADQGIDGGAATGFAFVVQNDWGFINLTKWTPSFAMGANGGTNRTYDMNSSYVRVAFTPTIGDWIMIAGGGVMNGTSLTTNPAAPPAAVLVDTKQTFLDLQAHGQLGDSEMGAYIQYADAPSTSHRNAYNNNPVGNSDRKAWTMGADYSIMNNLTIGAAFRIAQNGAPPVAGQNRNRDNAITLTAVYNWYQNVALHINHSQYSGSAHDAAGTPSHLTTVMMEAGW